MTLREGEIRYVQGSAAAPYEVKNVGGVYSCSCPAWRNQSAKIDVRTCKHLKGLLGEASELARIGGKSEAGGEPRPGGAPHKLRPDEKAKLNGPPVLLAHSFDEADIDPTGWWVSEKLDGVRAYWNGTDFISRQGNVFAAPAWFKAGLPSHPLDGELWMGRKQFQATISVVKRQDGGERWRTIQYVVFDAPTYDGPFEERQTFLNLMPRAPYMRILDQTPLTDATLLKPLLDKLVEQGGEGLMLRKPNSAYEVGRSWTLLKAKPFFDAEAVVVSHIPGKGKFANWLGALEVVDGQGRRFQLGTGLSDAQRKNPPTIGARVTYRFTERTDGGAPRFPRLIAVRDYE